MTAIDWLIVSGVFGFIILSVIKTKNHTKTVADFLAANRSAGKYLIAVAEGVAGLGAISVIAMMQMYYENGFTATWWQMMTLPVSTIVPISGFVIYRFRQTRAMTMAEFFEMRYSKNFRIFAGFLGFISGIINFGIFPAVGARFFMYFCGFPDNFELFGLRLASYPILLLVLISISLFFTFVGGQIAVVVADFIQGTFCNIVFILIVVYLSYKIPWTKISEALLNSPSGKSMVHPFQIGKLENFNIWYFLISLFIMFYNCRGWQGNQGYNCSAKDAHQAKMAAVLGVFRGFMLYLFLAVLPICVYTFINHPDYISQTVPLNAIINTISNEEIRHQMTVPIVLSKILPIGLMGAFCAVMLAALVSTHDTYLHSWGSILVQDVILPVYGRRISSNKHFWLLRFSIIGVAIFIFLFSLIFKQTEHILLFFMITGAIYLGGMGAVIIGGLYWKYGNTRGAWAAAVIGSVIAVSGVVIPQFHKDFLPFDSKWMTAISMGFAVASYVLLSLATSKEEFNLDKMLHRGRYSVSEDKTSPPITGLKSLLITKEYSWDDKIIYVVAMGKMIILTIIFIIGTIINLINQSSPESWLNFWKIYLLIYFIFAVIGAVWLLIGGLIDMKKMFTSLRVLKRDESDDGFVEH